MVKKANVKVLSETKTGLNNKLRIDGKVYTNNQAYNKAKRGEISGYHGVKKADDIKFIRSDPDDSKLNNLG